MAYIISRPYALPKSSKDMAAAVWFNMWRERQWPYKELFVGDVLFWFESKTKRLVWETKVAKIERFSYPDKETAARIMQRKLGRVNKGQHYYRNAPAHGVCLAYTVAPIRRLNLSKPSSVRVPQLGWSRPGEPFFKELFGEQVFAEGATLDDIAPSGSLADRIRTLDEKMTGVSPARIKTLVEQTIRRDTRLVKALKELCAFRCQFPNCGVRIPKRGGGFYVEVAHVEPVAGGGRSRLGNLLVLCPNHHKEFDWGDRVVLEQTRDVVRGRLNGKEFEIRIPFSAARKG